MPDMDGHTRQDGTMPDHGPPSQTAKVANIHPSSTTTVDFNTSLSMDNPSCEGWDMTVPAVRGCPRHSGGAVGTINIVTNDPEATRAPEIPLRPKNKKTYKILDIV